MKKDCVLNAKAAEIVALDFPVLSGSKKMKLSIFLNISNWTKKTFLKTYTFKAYGRISLKEKKPSYDCIFFKDKKCLIYPVRPFQCISFPFWPPNLASKQSWEDLKTNCPGIDQENLFSKEKIETLLADYQTDLAKPL